MFDDSVTLLFTLHRSTCVPTAKTRLFSAAAIKTTILKVLSTSKHALKLILYTKRQMIAFPKINFVIKVSKTINLTVPLNYSHPNLEVNDAPGFHKLVTRKPLVANLDYQESSNNHLSVFLL